MERGCEVGTGMVDPTRAEIRLNRRCLGRCAACQMASAASMRFLVSRSGLRVASLPALGKYGSAP